MRRIKVPTPPIIDDTGDDRVLPTASELENLTAQLEEIPSDLPEVESESISGVPEPEVQLEPVESDPTVNVAEAVEADGAQIFQSYQAENDEPIDVESTTTTGEASVPEPSASIEIVLLDYFPNTPEEYEQGFRRISAKEKKGWGITQLEDEYDTLAGMSSLLGVARNTAETWIYQCIDYYPSGFLKTKRGLTTECLKVLQLYGDYCGGENYTRNRKNRFLKRLEEQYEQYKAYMQAHHDKKAIAQEGESTALTHIPALDGEFVDESTQLQIQVSFERSDRQYQSGIDDYVSAMTINTLCDVYKRVSTVAKPLMNEVIQNGLTGKDLPDLSKIIKDQ